MTTLAKYSPPPLLDRYLERVLPPGGAVPGTVRIGQRGEMLTKLNGPWRPFTAVEDFSLDTVSFAWRARFRLAPLVPLVVVDGYREGRGRLDARLWDLIPVMRRHGSEIDSGEALRYLCELPWAPQAISLNHELEWSQLDESTVGVSLRRGTRTVTAQLHFNAEGDIVDASAQRPREVDGEWIPTPWVGTFRDYTELGGVRVPLHAEAQWSLPEGPMVYWRGTTTSFEHIPSQI